MADYLPKFDEGDAITIVATGTVTGGQVITVAGVVAGANAADWLGVCGRDVVAGQPATVWMGAVQRPQAAGALSVGTLVKCAAAGQVTTWVSGTDAVERLVGITLEAASGAGSLVATRFIR